MTPRGSTRRFSSCIYFIMIFHLCWSLTWLFLRHGRMTRRCFKGVFLCSAVRGKEVEKKNLSSKTKCLCALAGKGLTEHQVQFPAQQFNCCRPGKHLRERRLLLGTSFFKALSESQSTEWIDTETRNWVFFPNSNDLNPIELSLSRNFLVVDFRVPSSVTRLFLKRAHHIGVGHFKAGFPNPSLHQSHLKSLAKQLVGPLLGAVSVDLGGAYQSAFPNSS